MHSIIECRDVYRSFIQEKGNEKKEYKSIHLTIVGGFWAEQFSTFGVHKENGAKSTNQINKNKQIE